MYQLAETPEADAVEILRLGDMLFNEERASPTGPVLDLGPLSPYSHAVVSVTRVEGDVARAILSLWRRLPDADWMRCHNPPLALRFLKSGDEILAASICWSCNNIYLRKDGAEKAARFDGQAPESVELYRLLCQLSGVPDGTPL